jgi:hypothetical protein
LLDIDASASAIYHCKCGNTVIKRENAADVATTAAGVEQKLDEKSIR